MQERTEIISQESAAMAATQSGGIVCMIERLARDPAVDVAKFEKLVLLQAEMEDRQEKRESAKRAEAARLAYCAAFAEMQGNLPAVKKNKKNNETHSTYADINAIEEQIRPILLRFGFFVTHKVIQSDPAFVTVETFLTHKQGHSESLTLTYPLDKFGPKGNVNKTDIHATTSAITYASRVGKARIIGVSVEEDDDGNAAGQSQKKVNDVQRDAIAALVMEANEETQQRFTEFYGCAANVPASAYDKVCAGLRKGRTEAKENVDANV